MFFNHKTVLMTRATALALTACGDNSPAEKAKDAASENIDQNGAC